MRFGFNVSREYQGPGRGTSEFQQFFDFPAYTNTKFYCLTRVTSVAEQ